MLTSVGMLLLHQTLGCILLPGLFIPQWHVSIRKESPTSCLPLCHVQVCFFAFSSLKNILYDRKWTFSKAKSLCIIQCIRVFQQKSFFWMIRLNNTLQEWWYRVGSAHESVLSKGSRKFRLMAAVLKVFDWLSRWTEREVQTSISHLVQDNITTENSDSKRKVDTSISAWLNVNCTGKQVWKKLKQTL